MLKKAGQPGWGGFIPIYKIYLQIKLAGRSGMLLILYIVAIVNIVVAIVIAVGVARAFGKGPLYGFFLLFVLEPIGYLILGFGSAEYRKSSARAAPTVFTSSIQARGGAQEAGSCRRPPW